MMIDNITTQDLIDRMNSVIDDIEQDRLDYARDTAQVVRDALLEIQQREKETS